MICNICGDAHKTVQYWPKKRQALCCTCKADTPDKLSREEFEAAYWIDGIETVPDNIRREFYSDYKASNLTFRMYVKATCESY